jgi:signal transduction histidine kinase
MKIISKQSEGWVINSKPNLFLYARLKLTAVYVLIIAVIISIFSAFLYYNITSNLSDRHNESFFIKASEIQYIKVQSQSVKDTLVFSDFGILLLAAILSFKLAGDTLRPIQRSMEFQTRFTADASHELRTPLAIMKTDCEVALRSNNLPREVRRIFESNVEEVNKMTEMVANLLFLARSDNAVGHAEFGKINLLVLLKNIVERVTGLAREKGISLNFENNFIKNSSGGSVGASSGFSVLGNKLLLERAIMNIIQNSLDHTGKGGAIFVKIQQMAKSVEISIKDSGEGIDEKHLPYIFERFYKGDASRSHIQGGSGLGLSIVKEIVEQHQGKITIDSVKGKGTEVKITFFSPLLSV